MAELLAIVGLAVSACAVTKACCRGEPTEAAAELSPEVALFLFVKDVRKQLKNSASDDFLRRARDFGNRWVDTGGSGAASEEEEKQIVDPPTSGAFEILYLEPIPLKSIVTEDDFKEVLEIDPLKTNAKDTKRIQNFQFRSVPRDKENESDEAAAGWSIEGRQSTNTEQAGYSWRIVEGRVSACGGRMYWIEEQKNSNDSVDRVFCVGSRSKGVWFQQSNRKKIGGYRSVSRSEAKSSLARFQTAMKNAKR